MASNPIGQRHGVLPFVNRLEEISALQADIQVNRDTNRAVFLVAESGIGKSRLSQHVIELIDDRPRIKLQVRGIRSKLAPDGHFVRALAIACDAESQHDKRIPSFEGFLASRPFIKQVKRPLQDVASALVDTNTTLKTLRAVAKALDTKAPSALKVFSDPTAESCISAFDYLTYVLTVCRPLINIENFQDIDDTSLELITRAIAQSVGQYFLLEFTVDPSNARTLLLLHDSLREAGVDVASYPLEKLKVEHVLEILKGQPSAIEGLVRQLYIHSNGSLRPLTDLVLQTNTPLKQGALLLGYGHLRSLADFTALTVDELSAAERFVLAAVGIHGGWIESDFLMRASVSSAIVPASVDIDATLAVLADKALVEFDEVRRVRVAERVAGTLGEPLFTRERALAVQLWKGAYSDLYRNNRDAYFSRAELLHYLVYFYYLEGDIFECAKILDEAMLLASKSYAPSRFIVFTQAIRTKLRSGGDNPLAAVIDERIAGALQSLGFFNEALDVSRELPEGVTRTLYLAVLLENSGHGLEALRICDDILRNAEVHPGDRLWVRFSLAKFAALRSLNRAHECVAVFESLLKHCSKESYEFGFVLRMAGSCLASRAAIPHLQKSVAHFAVHEAVLQEAFSRIELSVALASEGELPMAELELDAAENQLEGQISQRHTIYNDRACIFLQQKLSGQNTAGLLRQAALTARSGFDRVAVQMNYFINLALQKSSQAEETAASFMEYCLGQKFSSRELICLCYFNLALFYGKAGNYLEYSANTRAYESLVSELGRDGWTALPEVSEAADFGDAIAALNYFPIYLADWHMELVRPARVRYE